WIPARLTGYITMISMKPEGMTFKKALQIFRRDANQHNSPNSGWGEGSVAALLGIQLGGVNYYHGKESLSPTIGEAIHTIQINNIVKAIVILQSTVLLFIVMLIHLVYFYKLSIFI